MTYASMLFFFTIFKQTMIIIAVILAGIFLLAGFSIWKSTLSKKITKKLVASLIPEKYRGSTAAALLDFEGSLRKIRGRQWLQAVGLTLSGWILYYLTVYLLAASINIHIPFFFLVACVSITAVITLIPISISGIGTRDAVLILLFAQLGLSQESAVAFAVMILFMYAVNGLIGLVAWLYKPVRIV